MLWIVAILNWVRCNFRDLGDTFLYNGWINAILVESLGMLNCFYNFLFGCFEIWLFGVLVLTVGVELWR